MKHNFNISYFDKGWRSVATMRLASGNYLVREYARDASDLSHHFFLSLVYPDGIDLDEALKSFGGFKKGDVDPNSRYAEVLKVEYANEQGDYIELAYSTGTNFKTLLRDINEKAQDYYDR